MLKNYKAILLFIITVIFISIICQNSKVEVLKADSVASNEYVLNDDIHTFTAKDGKIFILSKDNNKSISLISCFDTNSKTFIYRREIPYLYDAHACDGSSIYLARNDSSKKTITIDKYLNSDENIYCDVESIKLNNKNLLNSDSFTVDLNGTIFFINWYDSSKIYAYLWEDESMENIGSGMGPFKYIKMNTSANILYATTESNQFISFNTNDDYKSTKISCTDEIPPNYNFINDNIFVSYYGKVYKVDTDKNVINFLFNIQNDNEEKLIYEFCDKILASSIDNKLNLFNLEGNKVAELSLNANIIDLCVNNELVVVLTSYEDTKYINIARLENFNVEFDNKDGPDNGDNDKPDINNDSKFEVTSRVYDFNMDDYTITNVDLGTTIAEFKNGIECKDYNLTFKNYLGKEIKSGKLGTGATALFSKGDDSYKFTFIVAGDLTGEGNSNSRDINLLMNHILEKEKLEGVYLKAADLNNDGEITALDLFMLIRKLNS